MFATYKLLLDCIKYDTKFTKVIKLIKAQTLLIHWVYLSVVGIYYTNIITSFHFKFQNY